LGTAELKEIIAVLVDFEHQELLELLTYQNVSGANFGMIIAQFQDALTTQAYLSQLERLDASKVSVLLNQQNKNGWSVGMFIARCQNAVTTQAYLSQLERLDASKVSVLLKQQDKHGWSVGMFITQYQDAITTQKYKKLITPSSNVQSVTSSWLPNFWTQSSSEKLISDKSTPPIQTVQSIGCGSRD
jgi:ABC-type transporter Mla MlaB component